MPPSDTATFGPYLRSLRLGRGLSLRDVERASDGKLSDGYLSQIESGKRPPPGARLLSLLATVYAVPVETLFEKAGYVPSPTTSDVDVAFDQVKADANFQFGTRLKGEHDEDAKREIIELYEQVTRKKLLP